MDKRELQKLLSQPYQQQNWKEIVQFVFPNVSILSTPKEFPISNDKIVKFSQIGNVRLNDGKTLALFELLLADSVNLQRNRVELNNEISKYIDQEQIHGVLSVFEQGGDDYRFTFSAKSTEFVTEESDFVQTKTDTKRYTYVLGKNESCKTPADRFYALSESKEKVEIQDIQQAFSVERLSKEFFERYKRQFDKFWHFIAKDQDLNRVFHANDQEKRELKIRDFTKKLLGRIVFLHFLQKKGWMGCPNKGSWGAGDKQFMYNLFNNYSDKEHFHSICLAELFYKTLNRRRDNDQFSLEGVSESLNNTKIPYLNGGLFDSDEVESRKIDFPPEYFEELLEFFGQYNFTIDENDPNDHEVGIDPEMLGHIFENLLEDNKDKGAFYTPKVIVQYMCQESLIQYLSNRINPNESFKVNNAIVELVRNRAAEQCSDLDLIEDVSKALYDVKICDPAIGSGAFPMGVLTSIFQVVGDLWLIQPDTVARVWKISDSSWEPHLVKKNIIQHSIYGVDLESGAVDIARLRFWLALVVDEEEPIPLPNLDYKIMQGNSLLESFEGIDLSKISDAEAYETVFESEQIDMFTGEAKKKTTISLNFEDIKALMDDYFSADDPEEKKNLHNRIDEQVLNHIRFTLAQHKQKLLDLSQELDKKIKAKESALRNWQQKEKIRTTSKEAKSLAKLRSQLDDYSKKEVALGSLSNSNERPFFLWHLFYSEIFEEGGFDIMIGNPPYIQLQKIKEESEKLKQENYDTFIRTGDIYCLFYEQGFNFLREGGVLTYITSNKWMRGAYGKKLRKLFTQINTKKIINLGPGIFHSATVDTNIYLGVKKEFKDEVMGISLKKRKELNALNENDMLPMKELGEEAWIILNANELLINAAFKDCGKPLNEWNVEINRGVLTGYNEAFIVDSATRESLISSDPRLKDIIQPIVKGKEIQRYTALSEEYIVFIPWHFPLHDDTSIVGASQEAEREFEKQYPQLHKYLESHKEGLENRNQAETGIRYEWYALQRCAATYHSEFKKEKLIWKRIGSIMRFAYSNEELYCLDSTCIATGEKIKYLTAVLNSKAGRYQLIKTSPQTGTGDQIISVQALEPMLVHYPKGENEMKINLFVDYILFLKSQVRDVIPSVSNNTIVDSFEGVIDQIVFELYFEKHLKENGIDVLRFIDYPDINEVTEQSKKEEIVRMVYNDLQGTRNEIRNRILKSYTRSPNIIKYINDNVVK